MKSKREELIGEYEKSVLLKEQVFTAWLQIYDEEMSRFMQKFINKAEKRLAAMLREIDEMDDEGNDPEGRTPVPKPPTPPPVPPPYYAPEPRNPGDWAKNWRLVGREWRYTGAPRVS